MNLKVTSNVDFHHTNQEYPCLVVEILRKDNNIRRRYDLDVLFDWIPTDEEILLLCKKLMEISPTFKLKLKHIVGDNY